MSTRDLSLGLGNSILRSMRPGRSNAGSRMSIRFVAMSTCTELGMLLRVASLLHGLFAGACDAMQDAIWGPLTPGREVTQGYAHHKMPACFGLQFPVVMASVGCELQVHKQLQWSSQTHKVAERAVSSRRKTTCTSQHICTRSVHILFRSLQQTMPAMCNINTVEFH
jgi:hypothetical protein